MPSIHVKARGPPDCHLGPWEAETVSPWRKPFKHTSQNSRWAPGSVGDTASYGEEDPGRHLKSISWDYKNTYTNIHACTRPTAHTHKHTWVRQKIIISIRRREMTCQLSVCHEAWELKLQAPDANMNSQIQWLMPVSPMPMRMEGGGSCTLLASDSSQNENKMKSFLFTERSCLVKERGKKERKEESSYTRSIFDPLTSICTQVHTCAHIHTNTTHLNLHRKKKTVWHQTICAAITAQRATER